MIYSTLSPLDTIPASPKVSSSLNVQWAGYQLKYTHGLIQELRKVDLRKYFCCHAGLISGIKIELIETYVLPQPAQFSSSKII